MNAFRYFLWVFLAVLLIYTAVVILNHGANLFPAFFGELARMTWAGQFNLDFAGFLLLSGAWTVWRNGFTPGAWGLGILAVFFGMLFLTIYLLYLISRERGDLKRILLGPAQAPEARLR